MKKRLYFSPIIHYRLNLFLYKKQIIKYTNFSVGNKLETQAWEQVDKKNNSWANEEAVLRAIVYYNSKVPVLHKDYTYGPYWC